MCDDCRSLLEIPEYSYCLCDSNHTVIPPGQNFGKCPKCKDKKLSGLYFGLPYKEKALTRKLVHQFKYKPYLKDLAKTLASIIIEQLVISGRNTEIIWKNSALVPIPLEIKKIKTRGYNQSEELAKELSFFIKIPVLSDVLLKIKTTKAQMELSKEERHKNLAGAFIIKKPEKFSGKKVFLVDDVYTTGATMEECARILLAAGAKSVWGIAMTRENL